MHLGRAVHDCVVFIGFHDPNVVHGIKWVGTGFFLTYEGAGYLVTCRHIIEPLDGTPYIVRANRSDGGATIVEADQNTKWTYHPDPNIDLAAILFQLSPEDGHDSVYFHSDAVLADPAKMDVDVGDVCYLIGLFRYVTGKNRNLPLVYVGNVALQSLTEKIPVYNKQKQRNELVDAFLVQSHGIHGASGSPVLVRPSIGRLATGGVPLLGTDAKGTRILIQTQVLQNAVMLYGIYQGAWFMPPEESLREMIGAMPADSIPVGLGIVIPAARLFELMEVDELTRNRPRRPDAAEMTTIHTNRTSVEPAPSEFSAVPLEGDVP
jgi:Trypsin-like peptidase domain